MRIVVKRGPRNEGNKIRLPGKLRKRSAYSALKKDFFASDKDTLAIRK